MAPLAMAPPSDLTARPIQAPATSGSVQRKYLARNGRMTISTATKITTSEETMIGTIGRARMASGGTRLVHSREMKVIERYSELGPEGKDLAMLLLRLGRGRLGH